MLKIAAIALNSETVHISHTHAHKMIECRRKKISSIGARERGLLH